MKSELNKQQRTAIHRMIRMRIGSIDSIPILLERNRPLDAEREWKAYRALFALLDEIGWSLEDGRSDVPIDLHLDEHGVVLRMVRDQALSVLELGSEDRRNAQVFGEESALVALRATEGLIGEQED